MQKETYSNHKPQKSFIEMLETPELKVLIESLEHGSSDKQLLIQLHNELLEACGWQYYSDEQIAEWEGK